MLSGWFELFDEIVSAGAVVPVFESGVVAGCVPWSYLMESLLPLRLSELSLHANAKSRAEVAKIFSTVFMMNNLFGRD